MKPEEGRNAGGRAYPIFPSPLFISHLVQCFRGSAALIKTRPVCGVKFSYAGPPVSPLALVRERNSVGAALGVGDYSTFLFCPFSFSIVGAVAIRCRSVCFLSLLQLLQENYLYMNARGREVFSANFSLQHMHFIFTFPVKFYV